MFRCHVLVMLVILSSVGVVSAQAPIQASVQTVGFGCGPAAVIPNLSMTPPVIGGTATISVLHSFNPSPIIVFMSPGAPVFPPLSFPTALDPVGLCQVHLDISNTIQFVTLQGPAIPAATTSFPIPNFPALAGTTATLQAVVLVNPFPGPALPMVLTNAVHATIGF